MLRRVFAGLVVAGSAVSLTVGPAAHATTNVAITGTVRDAGAIPASPPLVIVQPGSVATSNSSGAYAIIVAAGTHAVAGILAPAGHPGVQLDAQSDPVLLNGNGVIDLFYPAVVNTPVTVVDPSGAPVPGATVQATATANGMYSHTDAISHGVHISFDESLTSAASTCTTDATGTCTIPELLGSSGNQVSVSLPDGTTATGGGDVPSTGAAFTVPVPGTATVSISGTVQTSDGTAVAGVPVQFVSASSPKRTLQATTDAAGHYTVSGLADNYSGVIAGTAYPGVPGVTISAQTDPVPATSDVTHDFVVPALARLHVLVVDENDIPVPNAIADGWPAVTSAVPAANGDGWTEFSPTCTTGPDGTCTVLRFLGSTDGDVLVTEPGGGQGQGLAGLINAMDTNITVSLRNLNQFSSQGSVPGRVELSTPDDVSPFFASLSPVSTVPEGAQALIGEIDARAQPMPNAIAGGTATFHLTLPPGAQLTHLYALSPAGPHDIIDRTSVHDGVVEIDVTDGSVGDIDGAANSMVVVHLIPAYRSVVQISTPSLPNAAVNQPYSMTVAADSGVAPYFFSLQSGSLPAGLSLDAATGTISGTPTALGSSTFTIGVYDSSLRARSASRTFTLTVATLAVATHALPNGPVAKTYSQKLLAAGGKTGYTWALAGGTLPAGVKLASTGVLSGIPTVSGTFPFTVKVTDATTPVHNTATLALSLTITPMAITTTSLPDAPVAGAYHGTVVVSGGKSGYQFSIAAGALPAGVVMAATTGVLSGAPKAVGTYHFTVKVTDSNTPTKRVATAALSITVVPMDIAPPALFDATIYKAYTSTTLKTVGGKSGFHWSVSAGALPTGLKLSSTGVLSGTPTAIGTFTFTVAVTDSSVPANAASRTYTITVGPMTVATTTLADATAHKSYSVALKTNGGKSAYTWVVTAGALPAGIKLATTGTLSGTPTLPGTYHFTVRVTDSATPKNVATAALTLVVH